MNLENKKGMGMLLLALLVWISCFSTPAQGSFRFSEPTKVSQVSHLDIAYAQISRDGLELYVAPEDENQCADIWVMRRASTREPWSDPVKLDSPVNTEWQETAPCLSASGLELYFENTDYGCGLYPHATGKNDLWVSCRATRQDPWGDPENLGPTINTAYAEEHPCLSADGLSLYFMSDRTGGYGNYDLYVSTRPTQDGPWGPAVNVGAPINSNKHESTPFISSDGLSLFFSAGVSLMPFSSEIVVSRRATLSSPWGQPTPFGPVQIPGRLEFFVSFSDNDPMLYFSNGDDFYNGRFALWQVEVNPIVDLNGDGSVDRLDAYELLDHWGKTDDSFYDIAPLPIGDGRVDNKDLIMMAEYMDPMDACLLAHWKLDEPGYGVAYDSVGHADGILQGDPIFQPEAGHVGGALQFDGMDDFLDVPFVLNPAEGVFSVFAWIKGGAPGQVILSQGNVANWLMVDEVQNALRSDISEPVKNVRGNLVEGLAIISRVSVTDGNWHRVGFTWDGMTRILYVDDIEVARDTVDGLADGVSGLIMGAGYNVEPGSYWSGMIDDVRIYNWAVEP